jgi:hypothetical protein
MLFLVCLFPEKEMELHAKYDAEAMTYLSYALYPLVFGYACYSLYYESHKSWYSFVLAVLTGCVYTFGFIMMCPQVRTGTCGGEFVRREKAVARDLIVFDSRLSFRL